MGLKIVCEIGGRWNLIISSIRGITLAVLSTTCSLVMQVYYKGKLKKATYICRLWKFQTGHILCMGGIWRRSWCLWNRNVSHYIFCDHSHHQLNISSYYLIPAQNRNKFIDSVLMYAMNMEIIEPEIYWPWRHTNRGLLDASRKKACKETYFHFHP